MRRGAGNGMPCQSGEDYIPTEHCQHPVRMGWRQYQTVFSKKAVRYWSPAAFGCVWQQVCCDQHWDAAQERQE